MKTPRGISVTDEKTAVIENGIVFTVLCVCVCFSNRRIGVHNGRYREGKKNPIHFWPIFRDEKSI